MGGAPTRLLLQARQVDKDTVPSPGASANPTFAAQSLNNLFHHAQTHPVPAFCRDIGIVGLSEPSEYAISEFCRNA